MRLKKLEISNFLSYNNASVDLEDLRKVLIVGSNNGDTTNSNGSGKTNLCEAIGWAIWGESKAKTVDLNVKDGTSMCSVRVDFEHNGKECSVTRTRNKDTGGSTLNFVMDGEPSNGKSVPDTDKKIVEEIKIDYLTYINSVYLRQDDIFSLANPKKGDEGRAVIEGVLNLKEYDKYEDTAKAKVKETEKTVTELNVLIESNSKLEESISALKQKIEKAECSLAECEAAIDSADNALLLAEQEYSKNKDLLVQLNSVNERLRLVTTSLESKRKDLEKDKQSGKSYITARETSTAELNKKIADKENIEKDRDNFLKEMEENYVLQRQIEELTTKLEAEKEVLKALNQTNRQNEMSKVSLNRDAETCKKELDKIGVDVKTVKVEPGKQCDVCMSDVSEHNIELIKAHNREKYENKHTELTQIVENLNKATEAYNSSLSEVKAKEKEISSIEKQIEQLRPRVISKKQYEDRLITYADKLNQISKYKSQLENMPETPIINMLLEKVAKLKKEVEEEEANENKLKAELNAINIDADSIKNMEIDIAAKKKIVESKKSEYQVINVNLENDKKTLASQEESLVKHQERQAQFKEVSEKLTVLEQLQKSFKIIKAKIIEDAIRDLESESDALLQRISNGRLSLKFVTEKSEKIVFEVHINDGQKSLPFSLYSGGEKFRIAFVLRIALSKLLLRKANSKLEFLIIDEAVSPLDQSGVENIMSIINELQDEFKTILVITHRNDIKNMFDKVITVFRDEDGSRII